MGADGEGLQMSEALVGGELSPVQPGEDEAHRIQKTVHPIRFTGSASEYFRIWIVNVFLSILTLGIYSAWAKVRTKQYFYRSTWLDGTSFEYLGDPIRILKGRLIAAAALGVLALSQHVSTAVYFVVFFLLMLSLPWVIVKAVSFNAHNSAWRNVRFSFRGTTGQAAVEYVKGFLLSVVTLGLGMVWMNWNLKRFVFTNLSFGRHPFGFHAKVSDYYWIHIRASLAMAAVIVPFMVVAAIASVVFASGASQTGTVVSTTALALVMNAAVLIAISYINVQIANLTWSSITVGDHQLHAHQKVREVLWLQITNVVAVLFSLGLAIPWARIRLHRYFLDHLKVRAVGALVAESEEAGGGVGAIGEGLGDLGGLGFDFG